MFKQFGNRIVNMDDVREFCRDADVCRAVATAQAITIDSVVPVVLIAYRDLPYTCGALLVGDSATEASAYFDDLISDSSGTRMTRTSMLTWLASSPNGIPITKIRDSDMATLNALVGNKYVTVHSTTGNVPMVTITGQGKAAIS